MAERTVPIRDSQHKPENGAVTASKEQIEGWLKATSALEVHDRGMSFKGVASVIRSATEALPGLARDLSHAWKSTSSARTQRALERLHATGLQLADTMDKMGDALVLYGRDYLPDALEHLQASGGSTATPSPSPGPSGSGSDEPTTPPTIGPEEPSSGLMPQASEVDDQRARYALKRLNNQILYLYENVVPESVTIDLPELNLPGSSGRKRKLPPMTPPPYEDGSYWQGGGSGSAGSGGSGGSGGTGSAQGSGGSGGSGGGLDGHDGPAQGGGDTPPGGTGSDGGAGQAGGQDPGQAGGQDPGQGGSRPGGSGSDGTAPPVIDGGAADGGDRQTQTQGTDPRGTESAGAPTPAPTAPVPSTGQPAPTTGYPGHPSQPGHPGYVAAPGGTPAVIGGSGSLGPAGAPAAAAVSRSGAGGVGTPFMPMGGAAGEQEQGQEGSSLLRGEPDMWHSPEDATSPVITG